MSLIFTSSSTFVTSNHKSHRHHHRLPHLTLIKSQNLSSESNESADNTSSSSSSTPSLGFGSSVSTSSPVKKQKGKKERARIIRRDPVETPKFVQQQQQQQQQQQNQQIGNNEVLNEQGSNERAFLLTWLGLGSLIIVEGIALAASGFLPEEWDALFVKYLYPSFTPTVFLFVAGTVVFGVVKYLENEKPNSSS
ncbi:protein LPA2 [Rutidosis leptorrhynchoides]|uniref:protein LPA2 n=1 Tax=Rutidosis leptorrhynchoides TaxID=125765 RepID=UPI003A9996AC